MDIEEIGRVYHYLLKHRAVESKPTQRRARAEEGLVASILRSASPDQLERFNRFLAPQGFTLVEFNDTMRGISPAGRVWVMARSGDVPASSFMSSERVYAEMNVRNTDSREASAVWFLHIWLLFLSLIYTRGNRSVSEVSGYVDATFSREVLEEAVQRHISEIRQLGIADPSRAKIVAILDEEKGTDVQRRVAAFLRLMLSGGLIQELGNEEYQQTLLGAYEIAHLYGRSLGLPVGDTLKALDDIVAPADRVDEGEDHGAD